MRKAAAGLSALVVSVAMLMGSAIAEQKPTSSANSRARASSAPRIASEQSVRSGFAKATRGKTVGQKKAGAQKHASARTKGSHGKAGRSRGDEAKVRPSRVRATPQVQGSVAGFLTGWPLTRPGSPGRFGGNHAKHRDLSRGAISWHKSFALMILCSSCPTSL